MRDAQWKLIFSKHTSAREKTLATLLCVGNGAIGVRGALPLAGSGEDHGGILVAGFYDQLPRPELDASTFNQFLISWSHLDKVEGYHKEACLIQCPDFLHGEWYAGDELLNLSAATLENVSRSLDLRTGEFAAQMTLKTATGKEVQLHYSRFAPLHCLSSVHSRWQVTPMNFSGGLRYVAQALPTRKNDNISGIYQDTNTDEDRRFYRLYDVENLEAQGENLLRMKVRGRVDGMIGHFALRVTAAKANKHSVQAVDEETLLLETAFDAAQGEPIELWHTGYFEAGVAAERGAMDRAIHCAESYDAALEKSMALWQARWQECDVEIEGDDRLALAIRHSIFSLLIAAHPQSDAVSVAAKGLSGEGYRGMVFWDTDIHMLPFYLYTQPNIAEKIVRFRQRTLPGARDKAKMMDCRGASYPWETGYSGAEECESFLKLLTHQLHITADVVHAMWLYYEATKDAAFYAEVLCPAALETALFWLDKGREFEGGFGIPDASGPDELHLEVNNSAYVNNLVDFTFGLVAAAERTLKKSDPELWTRLLADAGLSEADVRRIAELAGRVKTQKGENGLIEQFDGYFALRDDIVYEDDEYHVPSDTQTVKQADVMMLLYLLPDLCNREELMVNWQYYEPRTTHTSSLSLGVHGILAIRLGLLEKAAEYLERSLGIDLLSDTARADDGAHLAAYGMSWCTLVFGYGGIALGENGISVSPMLPKGWEKLTFRFQWRGAKLLVSIEPSGTEITCREGEIWVSAQGESRLLAQGDTMRA